MSVLQWVMFAFALPAAVALVGYTIRVLIDEHRHPEVTYRVWVPDDDPRRTWHKIP